MINLLNAVDAIQDYFSEPNQDLAKVQEKVINHTQYLWNTEEGDDEVRKIKEGMINELSEEECADMLLKALSKALSDHIKTLKKKL